jgi:hypothetical protein
MRHFSVYIQEDSAFDDPPDAHSRRSCNFKAHRSEMLSKALVIFGVQKSDMAARLTAAVSGARSQGNGNGDDSLIGRNLRDLNPVTR